MTEEDTSPKIEQEHSVDAAWIFDVDGVVTDPQEKKVKYPQILDRIASKINNKEPVALNTGRSLSWLIERRIINDLSERINDKKNLENLIVVGEKGGTWLTFDKDGTMHQHRDDSISVPESLQQKVRELVETNYPQSMFYDDSKQTMISAEMKDGYSIEEYKKDQALLNKQLVNLLEENSLSDQLKIDPTIIAVDVENKHVGKGFALERIFNWLKTKKIKPQQFIAFGDSRGDIAMAEKLNVENLPFEFVFVGNREDLEEKEYPFPITFTQKRFDKGTLEYLKQVA